MSDESGEPVRSMDLAHVGRDVREWTDSEGNRTVAFTFLGSLKPDGWVEPLQIGERVYFDGRPYGSPIIRGKVARIRRTTLAKSDPPCCIQYVVLRDE